MDKIEIIVNGEKLLELDEVDIETIKQAEKITATNFEKCVKSWATMIFLHRLKKAQDLLIFEANDTVISNLYNRNGITEIPTDKRKQVKLILSLKKKEKENASTDIYS